MIHFLGGMKKSSKMSKASKKISKPGEISTALRLRCHHDEVKKGKGEANPRRMAALLVEHLEAGKMVPPWENRYHGTLLNGVDDLFKGPPFSKIPPFSLWIVAWFLSWNLWRFLLLWLLTHTHTHICSMKRGPRTLGRLPATNSYLSSLGKWKSLRNLHLLATNCTLSPTMMVPVENICIWKVTIRLEDTSILHWTMELWEKLIVMVNPRLWSFNPSKLRVLLDYAWKNLCCKEKVQLRAKAIKVTRVMQGIVHAPETLTERKKGGLGKRCLGKKMKRIWHKNQTVKFVNLWGKVCAK